MLLTQKDLHQYLGNVWASITLAALLLGAPAQAHTPAGADWTISTVERTGERGYSGDGGQAVEAAQGRVLGVAVDGAGNLYIADNDNYRIRRLDSTGTITMVGRTGQVQNQISDADLEQSLESMSPMQVHRKRGVQATWISGGSRCSGPEQQFVDVRGLCHWLPAEGYVV